MKYFIVFAVVFLVAWRWRSARSSTIARTQQRKAQAPPTDMVACRQCGLHLPASEALPGRLGAYCSTAHRQTAER